MFRSEYRAIYSFKADSAVIFSFDEKRIVELAERRDIRCTISRDAMYIQGYGRDHIKRYL